MLLMAGSIPILLYSQQTILECHIKEPANGIYVVAHRGAHNGIPENTYQKAIDLGCDFVEIDIRT